MFNRTFLADKVGIAAFISISAMLALNVLALAAQTLAAQTLAAQTGAIASPALVAANIMVLA